jgi:hypothetical protein
MMVDERLVEDLIIIPALLVKVRVNNCPQVEHSLTLSVHYKRGA